MKTKLETKLDYSEMKRRFDVLVMTKDWEEVNKMYIELEEMGMSGTAIELSHTLTDEQVEEFKRWDVVMYGSLDTQMDDNS